MDDLRFDFNTSAQAPGLFLSPAEWTRLKDKLQDPFFTMLHERSVALLQELLSNPGEARGLSAREYKGIVQRAAVAWHVTGEEGYRDLAIGALMDACETSWAPSGRHRACGIHHADLGTGEFMHVVAFGYDALFESLSEQHRKTCVDALAQNGLARYLAGIRNEDWWVRCNFNWNSALHGNAGIAALALREHAPALSETALDQARNGLRYMMDAYYEGGGWTEGLMYFGTATGHLTDFAYALHRTTGDDFGVLSNRALHDSIDFAVAMHGGDGRPYNFSDCPEDRTGWSRPFVFWYADHLKRSDWTEDQQRKLESRRHEHLRTLFSDIDCFWFRKANQPALPRERKGLHHFKAIDWLIWRGDRSWLAFRSGYNGGNHNNRDLGQIVFGVDGTRYLVDPGYGAAHASMHNCPTVRLHDQTDGATACITALQELPGGFQLTCDISEAFPFVLDYYERHVAVVDDEHLVIVDDICGRNQIRNDMMGHFQTRLPACVTEEGFAIEGEAGRLRVVFGSDVDDLAVEEWEHRRETFNRLSWHDAYYRVHTVQPIVLTTTSAPISQKITASSVDVQVGATRISIPLRRSGEAIPAG